MEDYLIGVDIGTSSSKALAVSLKGKILAETGQRYATLHPQPDHSEQDPVLVAEVVIRIIGQLIRKQGRDPMGISFSAAMHSLMAVDRSGRPLTPLLLWSDTRSSGEAMALRSERSLAKRIYDHTGTPIHAMSPLCKLLWWQKHQPAMWKKAARFIGIKEYICWLLTGEYVIDHSLASATGLFDLRRLKWYEPALNKAGIDKSHLSAPVSSMQSFRVQQAVYRKKLHLRSDVPLVIGASDGCLANLGSGAIRPGDLAITVGTSGAVRMLSHKPLSDPRQSLFCYLLTEQEYVIGGAINNGGGLLDWYTQQIDEDAPDKEEYDDFMRTALSAPPGSEGLLFLPYLLGERSPVWDGFARGAYVGIDIRHSRAHFMRALLEGISFALKGIGGEVERQGGKVKQVIASGGFTKAPGWVQMLADMIGKPVQVSSDADASSLGAAMMGGVALGCWKNWKEATSFLKTVKTYQPEQHSHHQYERLYPLYASLYEALKNQLHALAAFQSTG